ncbi:MAG: discoidin domain-containing protein [Victivallales bacterium]|nr:discoidin domain-containing protein [Victivallales bacterium]
MKKWLMMTMLVAGVLLAENLVKNGGFDEGEVRFGELPSGWFTYGKPVQGWRYINYDGVSEANSIQAMPDEKGVTPLLQEVACEPSKAYTLKVAFKVDGCLPGVKVLAADGTQLALLQADAKETKVWKEKSVAFKTRAGDKKLTVVISVEGQKGNANVDSISIDAVSTEAAVIAPFKTDKENIALHKPYTCITNARIYGLCADPGDKVQLTDGIYTKGYFWTQKSTVGWTPKSAVEIRIDLGSVQPICGFSYNLAGGRAGVDWPKLINVYVSDDGKAWRRIGDLYAKSCEERGRPAEGVYAIYRAASLNMPAKGRYVSFVVDQQPYCFVDEIEIYKGDAALLTQENGVPSTDPLQDYKNTLFQARMIAELDAFVASLDDKPAWFQADYDALRKELSTAELPADSASLVTIIPYTPYQLKLYALNAKLMRAKGLKEPMIWRNNRWDNLSPIARPQLGKPEPLVVDMMRGEIRGETFNIFNPTDKAISCRVTVQGLPAGAGLDCREVLFTDTKQFVCVSGALKPGDGDSVTLTVEPGVSRQVWLSFKKPTLPKGSYDAKVAVVVDGKQTIGLPLTLNIHDVDFPKAPRLHVGGWDYVQGKADYYRAPGNIESNLAMMRSIYVDSPWGTNIVLPKGAKFDEAGHLTNAGELDYSNWIAWEERWKGARQWCVFASVKDNFNGEKMGTPRFETMIVEYYRAFLAFLKTRGIKPSQLIILLVDEPFSHERDRVIVGWGRPLKKALPELVLFEDPIYANPEEAIMDMYEVSDILCPNTIRTVNFGHKPFFLNYKAKGKTLWLYSCSGPARSLDPVAYHRGQMWHCFEMGAKGAFYWALGCGGGIGDSWHAFNQSGVEYSPYFVSQTDTMDAKQSEGVREGVQDYELLCMLQERVAARKAAGKVDATVTAAEKLLTEGVASVLESIAPPPDTNGVTGWFWSEPKDRSVMDKVRVQALNLLEKLK